MKVIKAADLFCGAGGTSTGLAKACADLGFGLDLIAINHWQIAIDTHSANHPSMNHLCESLDNVDPRKLVKGGRLNILVASPECTHHSNARGGRPMNDQSRSGAFMVLRWAEALYIDTLIIENVPEFKTWGPLGANKRPLVSKKGHAFQAFIVQLQALGYNVEYKILNAADFGDATTRKRLFIIARRGNKTINWPVATHVKNTNADLFGSKVKPWVSAREIIDWNIKGKSIFERKHPLSKSTLNRIEAGLRKFGGKNAEPFLVILRNHADALSVDQPIPTVTTSGNHVGLCEPFIVKMYKGGSGAQSVEEPLPTVMTKNKFAVVEPFIVGQLGPRILRSVDEPLQTITTTSRGVMLVEPFIVRYNGGTTEAGTHRVHSVDEPMPTIASGGNQYGLVSPFLVKYNGSGVGVQSVDTPIDTITTKDRFGLVEGERLDIRFRMLQPHELAAAMGFPKGYKFTGNRTEIVKQIGNAVPVHIATALAKANIAA